MLRDHLRKIHAWQHGYVLQHASATQSQPGMVEKHVCKDRMVSASQKETLGVGNIFEVAIFVMNLFASRAHQKASVLVGTSLTRHQETQTLLAWTRSLQRRTGSHPM